MQPFSVTPHGVLAAGSDGFLARAARRPGVIQGALLQSSLRWFFLEASCPEVEDLQRAYCDH